MPTTKWVPFVAVHETVSHPWPLKVKEVREAKADSCLMASQFHYFSQANEVDIRDTQTRGIECTMMHRVDLPVRYPALEREEDTAFMRGLKKFRTTILQDEPWLYLRLFHGDIGTVVVLDPVRPQFPYQVEPKNVAGTLRRAVRQADKKRSHHAPS